MAEYTISKIKLPNGDICNIKDTTYSAGTGIGISGTTISNTGVTGIKGNSEGSYRTGQVNLTAANIGAYSTTEIDNKLKKYLPYAHYSNTNSNNSGKYYKISINSTTRWMLNFTVKLYHSYLAYDLQISGYNYGSNHWSDPAAIILGASTTQAINVIFGYDSDYHLWIAIPAKSYTGIDVLNATNGYQQITDIENLFSIELVDGEPTTKQETITAYRPWYRNETIPIDHGGTGATTAAAARTNLGLGSMATETAANYLKLSGGTMTGDLIIGETSSDGTVISAGSLKIGAKNDSYGIMPFASNWNSIGAGNLYWYRSYVTNYYGTTSYITNWASNNNIGTAATSSAAATKGLVNFYNDCAAGGTQTRTALQASATSNITLTLPNTTGTLALTSSTITGNAANVTGTVAIDHGGTGATTAAAARSNLGLGNVDNTADANKTVKDLTNFKVSSYALPATKGVRIQYPINSPVLISCQRTNGGGRLILLGGGYGAEGTVRNDFTEVVSPTISCFSWSLPNSTNIACSLEVMNNYSSGDATVYVWASGTCIFKEITALTTDAMNAKLLTEQSSLAWNKLISKPTTISGYGITDAKIASGAITLGSNTITPITNIAGKTGSTVTADALRTALGLSNAMHFLGVTTTNVSTGTANTTATVVIGGSNVTATAGDVVLYGSQEYVWGNSKWNLLGDESSYKVKQTAKSDPTASSTTSTTFIDTISQDANGVITATKKTLPSYVPTSAGVTAVTWDSTNKKLTRTINGSAADVVTIATIKTALGLAKADVGLSNVTNHAQVTSLQWDTTNKKLTYKVSEGTAANLLTFAAGSNISLTAESGKLTIANTYSAPVSSVAGKTGAVTLAKGDVGLGNVDNTADANKTVKYANMLTGFSSYSSAMSWGNQTGSVITCFASPNGGGWGFRDNNPASGQMSMTIDGTIYIKEGAVNIGDAVKSFSVSGKTVTYTTLWGNTGTFTTQDTDTDTKNTAGSTNSTSKLYLIGATSQAANPTTNSYQYTYTNNGLLSALKLGLNLNGTEKAHLEWNDTDQSIDFIFE